MISFNDEVKKRIRTFLWNVGTVSLVALLNAISANLGVLDLPDFAVLILGSLLGQITELHSNGKRRRTGKLS